MRFREYNNVTRAMNDELTPMKMTRNKSIQNMRNSIFSLFQWMVVGQTGLSGHHVVKHVEMEYSRERGIVPTHPRPTLEKDVREAPQKSDSAIWELVQVREIIVRGLLSKISTRDYAYFPFVNKRCHF